MTNTSQGVIGGSDIHHFLATHLTDTLNGAGGGSDWGLLDLCLSFSSRTDWWQNGDN